MSSEKSGTSPGSKRPELRKLTVQQVRQIDELLSLLGEYGEIRLIVERGVLKYINKVESHKAWKDEEEEEK